MNEGDRVLMLDGTTQSVVSVDYVRCIVQLERDRFTEQDLVPLADPDLDDPAAVARFIEHDWTISEAVRFSTEVKRCDLYPCACEYCYRVETYVDRELASVNHFVDAPKCDCVENECPCR